MSRWIKKDDKVVVIAGNDLGRTGNVLRRLEDRVVVQGINIRKKHAKRKTQVQAPSIIEIEMSIHISNVALCDNDGKAVKVKVKETKTGKELYYLKGQEEVTLRKIGK